MVEFLVSPLGKLLLRWLAILGLLAAAAGWGAMKMSQHDAAKIDKLETAKARVEAQYTTFIGQTAENGRKAEAERKAKEAADTKAKEKADADKKRVDAARNAELARLRKRDADLSAAGGVVPQGSPAPGGADVACFDRPKLNAALRDLLDEFREVAGSGQGAVDDLDVSKRWLLERRGN